MSRANPWVALHVGEDRVAASRSLRSWHERLVGNGVRAVGAVRDVVTDSWTRCLEAGVLPDSGGAPLALTGDALEQSREQSPLAIAIDAIFSTLSGIEDDARHVVAIADADARLLWLSGDPATVDGAQGMGFCAGGDWSERAAGTNAVGTAAALDHAVQIFSAEHLVTAVHEWTCSAAPIHDPTTGELIGVIDLTAELRTAHPHTLSLAKMAAAAAEATIRCHRLQRAQLLRVRWEAATAGRAAPSVLLDANGNLIAASDPGSAPPGAWLRDLAPGEVTLPDGRHGELEPLAGEGAILWLARQTARPSQLRLQTLGAGAFAQLGDDRPDRRLRSLEILMLLALHPTGLNAEELALALYGETGKAVTVRAQVHRLRAQLGEQVIATQPYRVTAPISADWRTVEDHVAAGQVSAALDAYRGALLPDSDAAPIVELRGWLEESLRRSILTTADPELLMRWLAHPAGAHDLAAARTLVNVLPHGDPRRAASTARLALAAAG